MTYLYAIFAANIIKKMELALDDIKSMIDSTDNRIINWNIDIDTFKVNSISDATEDSIVFVDKNAKNKEKLISETKARIIICDCIPSDSQTYENKCLIVVKNPKLFYARLVNQQLKKKPQGIHPTAVISPNAKIASGCYIGPHVCIGDAEIGENTFIHSNCSIYDHVKIGKNVIIDAGCVIGADGFGFVRDDEGVPVPFPQLGGVIIEDDVEIGANSCIDRGALQDTIIRKGVKIDNLVHIGHNAEIGEYTYIITCTAIGGSTKIGKRCWIAPSFILNKIQIGDDATVGYGATVLKSVPAGATYMGTPAMEVQKYVKLQNKFKKL